jgi:pimeloyl-ACP methyl ester carboxylesterase
VAEPLPTILIPGLLCSPRLYAAQLPTLWRYGPVIIADHTRADSVAGIASQILASAPPRFALAGLSMGGYVSFEILRQAPERVAKLALLDSQARPDTPEQSERRRSLIALARKGHFRQAAEALFPSMVHPARAEDEVLKALWLEMADHVGTEGFVRQQTAIMNRPDSRPDLAGIDCPSLVLVGEEDQLTPPDRAREMADTMPNAQLALVAGSGHLSTLEQPEAVTAAMAAWLDI